MTRSIHIRNQNPIEVVSQDWFAAIETENWLRFSVQVDSHKLAYATGSGRAMLAYLSPAEVRQLLETVRFERITAKTVSSRRELLASLQEVRKQGVSAVDSGTVPGVIAIAAPIFDADGRAMAAVTVGGSTSRLAECMRQVQDNVRGAAEAISRVMGYRGDWPPAVAR